MLGSLSINCQEMIAATITSFGHIFRRPIIKPHFMKVFSDTVVCVPLLHLRKMRAVEFTRTKNCHDIHVLSQCMETFDHDCMNINQGTAQLKKKSTEKPTTKWVERDTLALGTCRMAARRPSSLNPSIVGGRRVSRGKGICEADGGEKIACSVVDVIGEGSDAFPPGSSGHQGISVSSFSPLALNGQKLLLLLLASALVLQLFSCALTLPEVNITAASREWVGVRFQHDGEIAAFVCVFMWFLTHPSAEGRLFQAKICSLAVGLSLLGIC